MSEADFLWKGILVVTALGSCVTAWFILTGRSQSRKIEQPLEIREVDPCVQRKEHAAHAAEMSRRVSDLEKRMQATEHKMESDKEEIIRAGEKRMHEINREIARVKNDVAATPARTIALLKETKGLL